MKTNTNDVVAIGTSSRKLKRTSACAALVLTLSVFSNVSVSNATPATDAIATIEAYNVLNNASDLTTATLTTAGVTSIVEDNLARYKSEIAAAATGGADTLVEIQAIITGVNDAVTAEAAAAADAQNAAVAEAIATIESYNVLNNADALTTTLLSTAGITGSVIGNLAGYKSAITGVAIGGANTAPKIQTLVNTVNSGVATIEAYDSVTVSALANDSLTAVGVARTNAGNLAGYKKAIGGVAPNAANSTEKIQGLVDGINLSVSAIDTYNSISVSGLTNEALILIGVQNANAGNLAGYKIEIGAAADNYADTTTKIQALVDGINTKVLAIDNYVSGNALTVDSLTAVGVSGTVVGNIAGYRTAIGNADASTVAKIQAFVDSTNTSTTLNANLATIDGYDSSTVTSLTINALTAVGVTGTVADNLAGYKKAIGAAANSAADTLLEIQALVNTVNSTVTSIDAAGVFLNGLSNDTLTAIGVTGNIVGNLAAYKSALSVADASTVVKIQAIINTVNTTTTLNTNLATIDGYDSSTVTSLTNEILTAVGVTGNIVGNLAGYKYAIGAAASSAADTLLEIQALVDAVNSGVTGVDAEGAGAPGLTIGSLTIIGVTGTVADNLAGYKYAIGGADASTVAKIQAFVSAVNTGVTTIEGYGAGASALTIGALIAVGVTGTEAGNLAGYKKAIGAAESGAADTLLEIQDLVDVINGLVAAIQAYGDSEEVASDFSAALAYAGITGIVDGNLAGYKKQIGDAAIESADTVSDIQILVNLVNNTVTAIDTNPSSYITINTVNSGILASLGITGSVAGNNAAYVQALIGAANGAADTIEKIQTIVFDVNTDETLSANLATIEGYVSGDTLTIELLEAVGVTGTVAGNLAAYRSAIGAAAEFTVDTTAKIQALVTLVNANQLALATAATDAATAAANAASAAAQAAAQLAAAQAAAQAQAGAAAAATAAAAAAKVIADAKAAADAKAIADAKAAADKAAADAKAASDKAIADAKAAADKAAADAKAASDKAIADAKAAADKAAADAKAAADKAAADAETAAAAKAALANTVKVSGGSAGRITINLDLSDSYSGLKAQVLVRKAGSKTFTVLGTVTLGEAGEGKVSSKTAVAKGSVLRVVIGGKIVKTITR